MVTARLPPVAAPDTRPTTNALLSLFTMAFDFGESKPSDPTADFLAREREAAGVLSGDADLFGSSNAAGAGASADDFERSASAFPALDDDVAPAAAAPSTNNAGTSSGFGFDDFEDRPAAKPAADDEVGKFEQNFPELDDGPSNNTNGAAYHDDAVSISRSALHTKARKPSSLTDFMLDVE